MLGQSIAAKAAVRLLLWLGIVLTLSISRPLKLTSLVPDSSASMFSNGFNILPKAFTAMASSETYLNSIPFPSFMDGMITGGNMANIKPEYFDEVFVSNIFHETISN